MAEKLSESSWKGFAKKRDLDDTTLVKALARFDKTDESKPEPRLEALQEVDAQIAKQVLAIAKRKKELGDKPWKEAKDKLDAMLAETERLIKDARARIAAAAAAAKQQAEAEDEADSPALLSTKMIPLLRELRKPGVQMHALIATAGKNTAVLVMRRAIAPSRRKLLAEAVDAKGGVKYIGGECLFEKGALTFVVQSQASGLAKRLRAALLDQTDLRIKVRVRGDDGQEDEDGENEGEEAAEVEAGGGAPVDPLKATFERRTAALAERVSEALRLQQGDVSRIRAVKAFAAEKGAAGQYESALKALDTMEKLLAEGGSPAPGAPADAGQSAPTADALKAKMTALAPRIKEASATNADTKASLLRLVSSYQAHLKDGRLAEAQKSLADAESLLTGVKPTGGAVNYAKARLEWLNTRKEAESALKKLEKEIIAAYEDEPEMLSEIKKGVRKLDSVMKRLDVSLADKLDEGLNATEASRRTEINGQAREIIEGYLDYLDSDRLVEQITDNPFTPIDLPSTVGQALRDLARQLA